MKLTNKYNLPERIIRMLPEPYQPHVGRMSVTALIDSPRIRTLQWERWDDIIMDYSDLLSTIIGISVHELSERAAAEDEDAEHKLEFDKDSEGNELGITLVGKADNYFDSEIIDTKTKAVGFEKFGIKEIEEQLNTYAWMRRMRFEDVNKLTADIIYRDWKQRDTVKNDYPQILYQPLSINLWSFEQQEFFIKECLTYHKYHPYECLDSHRWKKPDSYAVKKKGKQRAERVLDTQAEAEQWIKENGRGDFIEKREGGCLRCEQYCRVRTVCKYSPHCIDKYKESK